jgi:hypothetical protein
LLAVAVLVAALMVKVGEQQVLLAAAVAVDALLRLSHLWVQPKPLRSGLVGLVFLEIILAVAVVHLLLAHTPPQMVPGVVVGELLLRLPT